MALLGLAVAALIPALAACGLGDKKAMTSTIINASKKAQEANYLEGRYGYTFEITETTASIPPGLSTKQTVEPVIPALIDFKQNRSALLVPEDPAAAAKAV